MTTSVFRPSIAAAAAARTAIVLVLASASTSAQKMGSINMDAPTLTQTFFAANGSVDVLVEYEAVTWAAGRAMQRLMDPDSGKRLRARVNRESKNAPVGQVRADRPVRIGDSNLAKGLWALSFEIGDDLQWSIVLRNVRDDDDEHRLPLQLREVDEHAKRLRLALLPGEDATEARLDVAFGTWRTSLPVGAGKADPEPRDKKGDAEAAEPTKRGETERGGGRREPDAPTSPRDAAAAERSATPPVNEPRPATTPATRSLPVSSPRGPRESIPRRTPRREPRL